MAISLTARRLSSRIFSPRPASFLLSKSSSSSALPSPSVSPSRKVADRIVKIFAVDPEGKKHEVLGLSGQSLLKALTNFGLIDPESHGHEELGACSAECEVHIAQEWFDRIPSASYDEAYTLRRNARRGILSTHARLGCQVILDQDLQGMVVAVPEPKPWKTDG
ncbi:Fdxh Adrenodoxin-like protein [Nymphaea thermarum]|nr:Fdxh Adrenodoxin-like protein [Nymphaea thermarum]